MGSILERVTTIALSVDYSSLSGQSGFGIDFLSGVEFKGLRKILDARMKEL